MIDRLGFDVSQGARTTGTAGSVSAAQGFGLAVGPVLGTLVYRLGLSMPYFTIAIGLVALGPAVFATRR